MRHSVPDVEEAVPLAGPEPPAEAAFRAEHGIKLGGVKRVHMPQPLPIMLRHHAVCKCWKCKAGIAPGKVGHPGRGRHWLPLLFVSWTCLLSIPFFVD